MLKKTRVALIKEAEELVRDLRPYRPHSPFSSMVYAQGEAEQDLETKIRGWFNRANLEVGSVTLGGSQSLFELMQGVFSETLAQSVVKRLDSAITLVKAAPENSKTTGIVSSIQTTHIPNTAFILMWMDKTHPPSVTVRTSQSLSKKSATHRAAWRWIQRKPCPRMYLRQTGLSRFLINY